MTIFEKIDLLRETQKMKATELYRGAKVSRSYWNKLKRTKGYGLSYEIAERMLLILGRKLIIVDISSL